MCGGGVMAYVCVCVCVCESSFLMQWLHGKAIMLRPPGVCRHSWVGSSCDRWLSMNLPWVVCQHVLSGDEEGPSDWLSTPLGEVESQVKKCDNNGVTLCCVCFLQSPVDVVTGGISPIGDLDRLLQDMDINRLRAVVFRDIVSHTQTHTNITSKPAFNIK